MRCITTKTLFREWLLSLPKEDRIFRPYNSCLCPLGQYTQSQVGASMYGSLGIGLGSGDGERRELPTWACAFVRLFDHECDINSSYAPAVALRILEKIK